MHLPLTAVFCDKPEKKIFMKYYLSAKEHLEIATTIGDAGVLLFMQYLRMASFDHPSITDEGVARSLGWTERKARRYRGELTKHGWYKQVSYTRPDGNKMINYHIGKEAVSRISKPKKELSHAPTGSASALGQFQREEE